MKYSLTAAALLAATVSADLCADGSTDDDGNYYCQEVTAITYTGVGGSGSYDKVTSMPSSGSCTSTPYDYSGSLAPFDEEVSFHMRGPLCLKQFAFYAPDSSSSKKAKARRSAHARRHAHGGVHGHQHHARDAQPAEEKRDPGLGTEVTAVIDGETVTWINEYSGVSTSASVAYDSSSSSSTATSTTAESASSYSSAAASSSSSDDSDSNSTSTSTGTGWTRQGYYNAADGTSEGIVFLNHEGGSGSGVFDYTYGNSLSYASSDGTTGASSSQILDDVELGSDIEVVIMTDTECSDDDCGFYRDGTVAYHGFDGANKAFFFEFEMPDTGETSASIYDPVNMPAIWLLNALIPRTLQYGVADCSCWTSGCGEFDVFEVLAAGDSRCKSTIHGNIAGGDSDYFARPTNGTIKAALLLYEDNFHIKVLNDDSDCFDTTMGDTFVTEMLADTYENSLEDLVSVFALSS